MRQRRRKSNCPIHFALEVFGDAWTLLIIRDLMFKGRTSYTDFLRAEEGIATNVLADRLVRLEQDRIIERVAGPGRASAGAYRLTERGIDLLPVMLEIIGWSAKYDPRTAADRRFVRRLQRDRATLETEIRVAINTRMTESDTSDDAPPKAPRPRRKKNQRKEISP